MDIEASSSSSLSNPSEPCTKTLLPYEYLYDNPFSDSDLSEISKKVQKMLWEIHLRCIRNRPAHWMALCDCMDDVALHLLRQPLAEQLAGCKHAGVRDMLQATNLTELGEEGRKLLWMCIDFLILQRDNWERNRMAVTTKVPEETFPSIFCFLHKALGIGPGDGYDYAVVTFLECRAKTMEHGCAIRCGWLEENVEDGLWPREPSTENVAFIKGFLATWDGTLN